MTDAATSRTRVMCHRRPFDDDVLEPLGLEQAAQRGHRNPVGVAAGNRGWITPEANWMFCACSAATMSLW